MFTRRRPGALRRRWSSSRRRATRSTTPSRRRSSATSAAAAATWASTRRPTPSTRGPGTASWWARTSATTRPARPTRDGAGRGPRPPLDAGPPGPAGTRVDEWYNYQAPDGAVVGGGGTDYSPRPAASTCSPRSTSRPTARTTATRRMTTIRSRGASATTAAARGTRAWATPQASFTEAPFLKHLLGGLEVAAGAVDGRRLRRAAGGNHAPTVTAQRNPSGDVQPGDPVAFTAQGTDRRRRHAHLRVGLRRRRHRDHQGRDAHLHRGRRVLREGDRHRRQGRHGQRRCCRSTVQPVSDNEEEVGVGGVVPGVLALEHHRLGELRHVHAGRHEGLHGDPGRHRDLVRDGGRVDGARPEQREATGHLVNGSRALAQPLQVRATDAANPDTAYAPVPRDRARA